MALAIYPGAAGNHAKRHNERTNMSATESAIKTAAAAFIAAAKLTTWPQEAHIAFVAKLLRAELGLDTTQVEALLTLAAECPSLLANASAFRQKLQGEAWGQPLPAAPEKAISGNRFAGLI